MNTDCEKVGLLPRVELKKELLVERALSSGLRLYSLEEFSLTSL